MTDVSRRRPSRADLLRIALLVAAVLGLTGLVLASGAEPRPQQSPAAPSPLPSGGTSDLVVAAAGNDAAPGTPDQPLATLQAAVDRAAAGATIWVEAGRYGGFAMDATTAGGRGGRVTVAARDKGAVTIAPTDTAAITTVSLRGVTRVRLVNLVIDGPAVRGPATGEVEHAAVFVDHSDGVTIEGSTIEATTGGFGIDSRYSSNVLVRGDDIAHNAVGVRLYAQGDPPSVHDVTIEGNWIHDSDSMVVNDAIPNNDFGANAIIWHTVGGPTLARDNQIWANRARSHDYGVDGGAFEIWGSGNVTITGNTVWDNVNVVETGTDGPPCDALTFTRNVAFAVHAGVGLILRCATNARIVHNTLVDLRSYAFELSDAGSGNRFATSIDGLVITDNIVAGVMPYSIPDQLSGTITVDRNLLWNPGGPLARLPDRSTVGRLPDLVARIGFDANGLVANPAFVDPESHDYRLASGSPALDRAAVVPGEDYVGAAPDLGRYEGEVDLTAPS